MKGNHMVAEDYNNASLKKRNLAAWVNISPEDLTWLNIEGNRKKKKQASETYTLD